MFISFQYDVPQWDEFKKKKRKKEDISTVLLKQ